MATHHTITSSSHRAATNALRDMATPQLEKLFPELSPALIGAVVSAVTCVSGSEFVALSTQRNYLARAKSIIGVETIGELRNVVLTRLFLHMLSVWQIQTP